MNNIFSIDRFWNYLKYNFIRRKQQYLLLLSLLLMTCMLSALSFYSLGFTFNPFIQLVIGIIILLGPCILEKNMTRYNGIFDFTFPVSNFERFLHFLLKYVLILPVVLYGIYFLFNSLFFGLILGAGMEEVTAMTLPENLTFKKVYILLAFQSFFLLGYFSFQKYALIKTIGLMMGGAFLFLLLLGGTVNIFDIYDIVQIGDKIGNETALTKGISYFLSGCFPLVIWIISYLKIREKEI